MRTNCPDCIWHTADGGRIIKGFSPCDECRSATLHDSQTDIGPAFVFHDRIRQHHMDVLVWEHEGKVGPRPVIEFPEAEQDPRDLPRMRWAETSHYCFRCSKDMRYEAVHGVRDREELSNECTILFAGGYGSFIDCIDSKFPTLTICHECGHELADWLGLDPRNWHTHSIYGGQHPDHHDNRGMPQ